MDKCTVLRHRKIPEAVRRLMSYAFDELGSESIWCSYLDGNNKLKMYGKNAALCFIIPTGRFWELMKDIRTQRIACITKRNGLTDKLHKAIAFVNFS